MLGSVKVFDTPCLAELGWGKAAAPECKRSAGEGAGGQGRAAGRAGRGIGCSSGGPEGCPFTDEPVCHGPPGGQACRMPLVILFILHIKVS